MTAGSKVICINDRFPPGIEKIYMNLPKAGIVYVIRDVVLGQNWRLEAGEVCLYLVGLHNPKSNVAPYPERGFNAERFRPLETRTEKIEQEQEAVV